MPPLPDEELTRWAREHLVYEVRMFAYAALRLDEIRDRPRDHASNVLLEAFAVHTRCLMEFLWGRRRSHHMDAFASDFCDEGGWDFTWEDLPPTLASLTEDRRFGQEVAHLSYERSNVPPNTKDWPISEIVHEIVEALQEFSICALPTRLDIDTRDAMEFPAGESKAGPVSVASQIVRPYTGGTIEVADFTIGS